MVLQNGKMMIICKKLQVMNI